MMADMLTIPEVAAAQQACIDAYSAAIAALADQLED